MDTPPEKNGLHVRRPWKDRYHSCKIQEQGIQHAEKPYGAEEAVFGQS